MRLCFSSLAFASSAWAFSAGSLAAPMTNRMSMSAELRTGAPVAIIEPELYRECAIYDADMEAKYVKLTAAVVEAESAAKAVVERLNSLETEVAEARAESTHLRENLQKQAASAAASAAAASSLEIEVTKLLRQLDEQGVEAAKQLKSETTSLRALLDDQSAAATKARADADRAEAIKRELREEIDAKIIEAAEARGEAARLAADLEDTQKKSADYLEAIEQIARVAASITETQTETVSF
jgi:chromosome segregation ATPase